MAEASATLNGSERIVSPLAVTARSTKPTPGLSTASAGNVAIPLIAFTESPETVALPLGSTAKLSRTGAPVATVWPCASTKRTATEGLSETPSTPSIGCSSKRMDAGGPKVRNGAVTADVPSRLIVTVPSPTQLLPKVRVQVESVGDTDHRPEPKLENVSPAPVPLPSPTHRNSGRTVTELAPHSPKLLEEEEVEPSRVVNTRAALLDPCAKGFLDDEISALPY